MTFSLLLFVSSSSSSFALDLNRAAHLIMTTAWLCVRACVVLLSRCSLLRLDLFLHLMACWIVIEMECNENANRAFVIAKPIQQNHVHIWHVCFNCAVRLRPFANRCAQQKQQNEFFRFLICSFEANKPISFIIALSIDKRLQFSFRSFLASLGLRFRFKFDAICNWIRRRSDSNREIAAPEKCRNRFSCVDRHVSRLATNNDNVTEKRIARPHFPSSNCYDIQPHLAQQVSRRTNANRFFFFFHSIILQITKSFKIECAQMKTSNKNRKSN